MPGIVVIGGGIVGLSAALMLAKAGHDVTVLERDAGPAGPAAMLSQAFGTALLYDADMFRAMTEIITMQALPGEVFSRPGFAGQVMAAAEGREAFAPPAPSRAELLGMLA